MLNKNYFETREVALLNILIDIFSGKSEVTQEFQCQICEKVLGTRHAALRHRKEVHSDIPIKANGEVGAPPSRVDCPKCERTFKNKSNLKIHMLTHSGVKPFGYVE